MCKSFRTPLLSIYIYALHASVYNNVWPTSFHIWGGSSRCITLISIPNFAAFFFLPHMAPASSPCVQSWTPQSSWEQSAINSSSPLQSTESSKMGPVPCPNSAFTAASPRVIPNCLHTTCASRSPHLWEDRGQSKKMKRPLRWWSICSVNTICSICSNVATQYKYTYTWPGKCWLEVKGAFLGCSPSIHTEEVSNILRQNKFCLAYVKDN